MRSDIPDPDQPPTVLLVEDDEAVRDAVCLGLTLQGLRVLDAANGDEAVMLCQALDGKIDAAVVDIVMPLEWGRDVVKRLAFHAPHMKVLYVSGHCEGFVLDCGALPPDDVFFGKPFKVADVADKIYEMLGFAAPATTLQPDDEAGGETQPDNRCRGDEKSSGGATV